MGDTNYFSGIVKILDTPTEKIINDKISSIIFPAEVPQFRKHKIVFLTFWGNLGRDVKNYYQINDYVLVEGYLSIKTKQSLNLRSTCSNQIRITVLKVYPFLLKSKLKIGKI